MGPTTLLEISVGCQREKTTLQEKAVNALKISMFFLYNQEKRKSLGTAKTCYQEIGFDNLSVLINLLLHSFETKPTACLGSGNTAA